MKQTQVVEEVDEDTLKVITTTFYNKEEYSRTFAPALAIERSWPALAIERSWPEKVTTFDCIYDHEEKQE